MHLDINLSLVYRDRSLLDAIDAASSSGFDRVEFWWPSEAALAGHTLDEIATALLEKGLGVDLLNVPAGDMAGGERGIAADPGRQAEFRDGVERALEFALKVGCTKVNALAGKVGPGDSLAEARKVATANLAWTALRASEVGASVVIEPLNGAENPGYVWTTVTGVADLLAELGQSNVGVLIDAYHIAMEGQDPAGVVESCPAPIGHVQLADHPGRHEPGSASLDYAALARALAGRYDGAIGLEFIAATAGAPDFDLVRRTLAEFRDG